MINGITAYTSLYAIFGNPVRHSISPIMHNNAFREKDIDAVYLAFEIDSIRDGVQAMRTLGIKGASVTIPFKTDVVDELDSIDSLAVKIGAVNTIVKEGTILKGYNTDGIGALKAINSIHPDVKGMKVMILGNGGSARAIAFTLLENGAEVTISGRMSSEQIKLCHDLNGHYKNAKSVITSDLTLAETEKYDLIINTTPLGMGKQKEQIPIHESLLLAKHTVFDIVYNPHETVLIQKAKSKGCKIVYGIDMLIYQGVKQFELWTGLEAPVDVMRKAASFLER